jgi:hypothetical protein
MTNSHEQSSTQPTQNVFATISNDQLAFKGVRPIEVIGADPKISQEQAEATVRRERGTPSSSHLVRFSFEDHTSSPGGGVFSPDMQRDLSGLFWGVELSDPPAFSRPGPGGVAEPTSSNVVGTYNLVFVNAETGEIVFGMSGELTSQS